jgi:hypothetical protein
MKQIYTILLFLIVLFSLSAQNSSKTDSRPQNQNVVLKIDGASGWSKADNDSPAAQGTPIVSNENVTFSSNSEGIFITVNAGTNKIKLFALTGQLLLNGDLSQGRFFIPTRKGIYFLRINNKSYKVICK